WRMATYSLNYFPMPNERGKIETQQPKLPAHLDLVEKIKEAEELIVLVMTVPLTDQVPPLDVDPDMRKNIGQLYWMGGTLDGHVNVAMFNADGSQEWNSFWDPYAVKRVFESNIPIQMVGLESTEELPLNDELRQHWASLRKYPAMDLIG